MDGKKKMSVSDEEGGKLGIGWGRRALARFPGCAYVLGKILGIPR